MLAMIEAAIGRGDITWHAAPMNQQYEMYSARHLDLSLNISSRLDRRFNISRQHPVISLRDVPGTVMKGRGRIGSFIASHPKKYWGERGKALHINGNC